MTNPTPHGQVPEALIDLIDAYAETRHRCGGIYNARTEAARKAVIEALSGVQALSAAPEAKKSALRTYPNPIVPLIKPVSEQEKMRALYLASSNLMAYLGRNGAIHSDGHAADVLMNCLNDLDGGEFDETLFAASPTPTAEQQAITPETEFPVSAKGAAITSESGTPTAEQEVIIDLAQVGTAGPFHVVNGRVKLPDATMQDLARMLRPTYEAEQAAPKAAPAVPTSVKGAMWFTKKPVTIQAIQWTGENLREVITFTDGPPDTRSHHAGMAWDAYRDLVARDGLKIYTLEGKMLASPGDWIIRGVKGELYPCKPDIFQETYAAASPTPPAEQQAAPKAAPGPVSDTRHSQFLSDVLTAAGLITHGKQCKALGARLSDMVMRLRAAPQQEAQEPVAWQSRTRPTWGGNTRPWSPWEPCTKEQAEDCWKTPLLHDWAYEARALFTAPQPAPAPLIARSLAEWHEDDGFVAWWAWNGREWAGEPAWIGNPNCEDWPGYHTHWTPHPDQPVFSALAAQGGK